MSTKTVIAIDHPENVKLNAQNVIDYCFHNNCGVRIIEPSDTVSLETTGAVPGGLDDAQTDALILIRHAFERIASGRCEVTPNKLIASNAPIRKMTIKDAIEIAENTVSLVTKLLEAAQPALAQVETEPTENDNEAISRVRNNVANKGYAFLFDDIATLMCCYDANPLPAQAENSEQEDTWGRFAAWLLDKCEGEIITEEFLQKALSDMLANTVAL